MLILIENQYRLKLFNDIYLSQIKSLSDWDDSILKLKETKYLPSSSFLKKVGRDTKNNNILLKISKINGMNLEILGLVIISKIKTKFKIRSFEVGDLSHQGIFLSQKLLNHLKFNNVFLREFINVLFSRITIIDKESHTLRFYNINYYSDANDGSSIYSD
ncbi:MAG: hypothetical protein HeimC2_26000, partial [Candidatus Heimdallarchaeota archaeon LC_2]